MLTLFFLAILCSLRVGYAQVGNRVCQWKEPRAAVVQDTFYLDGGQIWEAEFDSSTGQYSTSVMPFTSSLQGTGIVFMLYFNTSFKVSDDFFHLFQNDTGAGGLDDNPPFRSGFMFADDYEYYAFGGISLGDEGQKADLSNCQIYQPDGPTPQTSLSWRRQCNTHYLPESDADINRHITHGAGANVPSEYLGFYLSGLQLPSGGYIQENIDNTTTMVDTGGMVKVDMSFEGQAVWSNLSSPTVAGIPNRGGAALSWVPYGEKGLLVLTGGVPNPLEIDLSGVASTSITNYMEQVSVYDIANDAWYTQSTSGGPPPQLADFCAVVAHQENGSSYQIYIYGGFNGATATSSNSVWILSIPSFHWTEKQNPPADAGRYGHVCAMPYPDQMIIVGGLGTFEAPLFPRGEIVQVLNLSSLEWLEGYNPEIWQPYQIPDIVKSQDPGQKPADMDTTLATLFDTPQSNTGTPWYPYAVRSSSKNHWLAPVLGGVLGGVAVAVAGFLIWLFRHRKSGKSSRASLSQPPISEPPQVIPNRDVDQWRLQVKSIASSGAMEIDSSDRSTVNNEPPPEPVEIGGRTRLYSPRSPRSPDLSAAGVPPQSPQSGSVEVSGDPSFRQELQDTSPRQQPLDEVPPMAENPDYRFRNHPLFPLNVNDAKSESAVTSAQAQVSSVDEGEGGMTGTAMSHRAAPSGMDDINHVLYGRPGPPVPPKQRIGSLSDAAHLRHQPSTGRMPYEDIYPGDALPSPVGNELPTSPYVTFRGSRSFHVMGPDSGLASPRPHTISPAIQNHPGLHQRNTSDQSTATIQLPSPGHPLPPSPDPAEENRRSAYIEQMPDHPPPQQGDPSATWPQQPHGPWRAAPGTHIRVAPPANDAAVRRKEVGSPVKSAYEENKSRFRE